MPLVVFAEIIALLLFAPVCVAAVVKGVQLFVQEKKKIKYSTELDSCVEEASYIYQSLLKTQKKYPEVNLMDLSLLLAVLDDSSVQDYISSFYEVKKEDILEKFPTSENTEPIKRPEVISALKKRLDEYLQNSFVKSKRTMMPIDAIVALDDSSQTVAEVIGDLELQKIMSPEYDSKSVKSEEKKVVFYDHGYPEDDIPKTMKKQP